MFSIILRIFMILQFTPDICNHCLAKYVIQRALTIAKQENNTEAMRLFVTVGNSAVKFISQSLDLRPVPAFHLYLINYKTIYINKVNANTYFHFKTKKADSKQLYSLESAFLSSLRF